MIKHTEEKIFEFLDKELSNKGIKVYRGFLPQKSFEDRENGNYKENFPYVTLRIVEFKQERAGIDYYDSPVEFEIWVATKENGENDYLENLSLANEIMEKVPLIKKILIDIEVIGKIERNENIFTVITNQLKEQIKEEDRNGL